ncbi:MAG: DMT family transporter [Deferrisomatales bacterium]
MTDQAHGKRLATAAFVALGVIWGCNFIYMKLAAALIAPTQIVFLRVLFGFVPVLLFARARGALSRSHARHAGHFLVMSVLATSFYYYCFAAGAARLPSGIAGALSGAIPLFSFVLGVVFVAEERATPRKVLGVLLGLAGVLLMGRPSGQALAGTNAEGVLYVVAGSLSLAASFVYARRYVVPLRIPAAALVTYQLGLALVLLAVVTDLGQVGRLFGDLHAAVGLVVGLGLLGTGVAFILYYFIVDRLGAVTASSVTYIPPAVALLIGAVLVGEPIAAIDYGATAMILAGVYLLKR